MLSELGYKRLIIDSDVIHTIVNNNLLMDELICFSNIGQINILGASGDLKDVVKRSGGYCLPQPNNSTYDTTLESVQNDNYNSRINRLCSDLENVRNDVLHLKSANKAVLVDLAKTVYKMDYKAYQKKLDCGLRLVYHAMESCPFQCIYCFANYNHQTPTTILLDAHERLRSDLQDSHLKNLIQSGFPIHLGSISDLASKVALNFNLLPNALEELSKVNANIFIGTKSIHISDSFVLDLLKSFPGKIVITFSYTSLSALESNLPYSSETFPQNMLQKITNEGIRLVLLYRPIIPGMNDNPEQIESTITSAKKIGINQIGFGFAKFHVKILDQIKKRFEKEYDYFKSVCTDKIDDNFYPPKDYRERLAANIKKICNMHEIQYFYLCQSFLESNFYQDMTSPCICSTEYWQ